MAKSTLPGLSELKQRPVFDVNTLLGETEARHEARIVEVSNDPAGTGFSPYGAPRRDDNRSNSSGVEPQRAHDHEAIAEDAINPSHYRRHPSGIECIEVTRHMNFNLGQVFKYIWRMDYKGVPVEDLKKAQWYLDDEIRRLEGKR